MHFIKFNNQLTCITKRNRCMYLYNVQSEYVHNDEHCSSRKLILSSKTRTFTKPVICNTFF